MYNIKNMKKSLIFYNSEDVINPVEKEKAYSETLDYQITPQIRELYASQKVIVKNEEVVPLVGTIRPTLGYILYKIVSDNKLKNVLEIGTGYGLSALYLLEGLPEDGVLTTIDKEQESLYKNGGIINLFKSGKFDKVRFYEKESSVILPEFYSEGKIFDCVFIDSNKIFDNQINDVLCVDFITEIGSVIIIKSYSSRYAKLYSSNGMSQNAVIDYIDKNYRHWKKVENNFTNDNAVIYVKISEDVREWFDHKNF